ncbi:histidinol dehydrogenase [Nitratireductor sp.]|uniref:histidinol dehydrogenase n=1 Tax=Nitratireductor sp. TaxID=1872084 RepID=UPI002610880F|nr:histidinol dehydrogenase [Nitratireductor sp.]MCV0378958.1 histidinol dehydrogenase [Nitratireductor sp.]
MTIDAERATPVPGAAYFRKPQESILADNDAIEGTVKQILADVRRDGDAAVRAYSAKFDNVELDAIEVSQEQIRTALDNLDPAMREDTLFAIEQVRNFAEKQLATMLPLEVETLPGLTLGHRVIPIERIGAYVPGGRYPLMSAPIMTIVPAKVAGCDEVIACLPPSAHEAMIAGCHLSGADRIFLIGGAQAIAAMAYGTESVPRVDKIVGPGNAYVNEAKRQVFGPVGIDQLAGPSEVFVIADDTAAADMVAIDLLAQAEHDVRARVGLITTSPALAEAVEAEVARLLAELETSAVAAESWQRFGEIVLCDDVDAMIAYSDLVAPEHLEVITADSDAVAAKLRNYGSLFIGANASVVYSDKCCGTNHTLPTAGAGRYSGGLWVGAFVKVCTHQRLTTEAVAEVAPHAVRQSLYEGMEAHARAADYRLVAAGLGSKITKN